MKRHSYKLILMGVFILSACQKPTLSAINIVSIFDNGGSDVNYGASYIAGINYAIELLDDQGGTLVYKNIAPSGEVVNYTKIDAIIGTFKTNIYNDVITKKIQVPLIASRNEILLDKYLDGINYFPLGPNSDEEMKTLANTIEEDALIIVSHGKYFEECVVSISDELNKLGKDTNIFYIAENTKTYETIVNHIVSEIDKDLILILDKTDYASVIFHLSNKDYVRNIYIPYYLAKLGTLPPNYTHSKFLIKHLNYTFSDIDETLLQSRFIEVAQSEKYVDNYYYFRDGFIAYSLIFNAVENKKETQSITTALHNTYLEMSISEGFSVIHH